MRPHVIGFAGSSGSGKTTIIVRLIRFLVERGDSVCAVKHTHHTITEPFRGDSQAFLDAGASGVALVSPEGTFLFRSRRDVDRTSVVDPVQLIEGFACDRVFVEGFKFSDVWPRVLVEREGVGKPPIDRAAFAAIVSNIEPPGETTFTPDEVERLAAFLDRITA